MKKLISVILLLTFLCITVAAVAETWTCPGCGKEAQGNFCPWCGSQKPKETVTCSVCGTEYDPDAGFAFCSVCGNPLAAGSTEPEYIVGNIVTFGSYEQDNNLDNGTEPIEWIVLEVQNGKAFLISRYGLDTQPYNKNYADVSWESCTLRAWLNNEFINTAFSKTEQQSILLTEVDNSYGLGDSIFRDHFTRGANNTWDRIFLLSYHEVYDLNQYFRDDQSRICLPTDYALANRADTDYSYKVDGREPGYWWLRSPGCQDQAVRVDADGRQTICSVNCETLIIRPVLWISLE